ncbi:hypothetical protein ACTG16_15855 [Aeromonas sp. 23P]|uniref:hypothetical protein n=1 Tax=unclassified Aeromonas TaxID=257493 RepID=UPI003F7A3F78
MNLLLLRMGAKARYMISDMSESVSEDAVMKHALSYLFDMTNGFEIFRRPSEALPLLDSLITPRELERWAYEGPDGVLVFELLVSFVSSYQSSSLMRELMTIQVDDVYGHERP